MIGVGGSTEETSYARTTLYDEGILARWSTSAPSPAVISSTRTHVLEARLQPTEWGVSKHSRIQMAEKAGYIEYRM